MIFDGIAGIQFLLQGKFSHFTAIIKAHFYFYALLLNMLRKRKNNQQSNYYFTMSIIYHYFIKKEKNFVDKFNNSLS
jgi:hypothetical protein